MRYKVLKEFVNPFTESLMEPDDDVELINFDSDTNEARYYKNLANYGFIEEIKDGPWKPEFGDDYWFIDSDGEPACRQFKNEKWDLFRLTIGNHFQTKERTEKARDWLEAFKVLREDTKGFKPDWEDMEQGKWTVWYDYDEGEFSIQHQIAINDTIIYFGTRADAEESIKTHPHEWKVFLGIEES